MQIRHISKGKGRGTRTLYVPNADERKRLNELLPKIMLVAEGVNTVGGGLQHGFQPDHSPVTNAMQHVNYQYSLCMDLENFFDSVTPEHLPEELRFPECFPDGAARQGLPTSPALANIAANNMDMEIVALLPQSKGIVHRVFDLFSDGVTRIEYTRYADDLTFSCNSIERLRTLEKLVPRIAEKHGFKVKARKTRMQAAIAGRRIITGVAVDSKVHPTRRTRRKHRAAVHQRHTAEARGLAEWMRLVVPKFFNKTRPVPVFQTQQPKQPTKKVDPPHTSRVFNFD